MEIHSLSPPSNVPLFFVGPGIEAGPLPAIFYFAVSAKESLSVDPFDQFPTFLSSFPVRIFSVDLPGHGPNLPSVEALKIWAENYSAGKNAIQDFVDAMKTNIEYLVQEGLILPERTAVAGLSRGAFIATHVAAQISWISTILGFAPLTILGFAKEFHEMQGSPLVSSLDLVHCAEALIHKKLRFYISNRDKRVGTDHCFHFISTLAETAFHHRVRSPQVELLIKPPIGHQGHGTSKEIFEEGALWLMKEWGLHG